MTEDEVLKNLWSKSGQPVSAVLEWAEVLSINPEEQTMDVRAVSDGLELFDVQLGAGSVVVYPKVGSLCIIGLLEGMATDAILVSASKVERIDITASTVISLNGGKNGGLINIETLTERINSLVDTFNGHTHQVSTTGSATAQTGTAAAPATKAEKLNKEDYEDNKVTH